MIRFPSFLPTLLLTLIVPFCSELSAKKIEFETVSGETIKAELIGFYNGIVYFDTGGGKTSYINLIGLTPKSQEPVKAWLQQQIESLSQPPVKMAESESKLTQFLAKNLVSNQQNSLQPWDVENKDEPQFYAFYFSARWCGPCRRFTPKLRAFYNSMRLQGHDNFEIVFVSSDENSKMMQKYMEEDKMPWPGINYSKKGNDLVSKYSGNGIPCLVVTDRDGHLLFHSYRGDEYLGPSDPMNKLKELLAYTAKLKRTVEKQSKAQ